MSETTPSHEEKVVPSNESQAAPIKPDQPGQEAPVPEEIDVAKIDVAKMFKEAFERSSNMTKEEVEKELPWIKDHPPASVDPVTAMAYLEKITYGEDEEEVGTAEGEATQTADASKKTP